MSDPIANMLTQIRNGLKAKFNSVDIPVSKLKTELAKILKNEGFIKNYTYIQNEKHGILRIYLKYSEDRKATICGLKRISKPSRRVYVKSKDIKPVLNGLGISILSTSKGIVSDKTAKKENVGGEILCHIW